MHSKHLNRTCKIAGGKERSFLESVCNKSTLNPDDKFPHQFFQVSSLYGQILFQSVHFLDVGRVVQVNYVSNSSEIMYWAPSGGEGKPDILEFKNKIFEFDYPALEKIKNKTSVLAPFL
jgi:hypothetical protein